MREEPNWQRSDCYYEAAQNLSLEFLVCYFNWRYWFLSYWELAKEKV
jgi:hypothetical protein